MSSGATWAAGVFSSVLIDRVEHMSTEFESAAAQLGRDQRTASSKEDPAAGAAQAADLPWTHRPVMEDIGLGARSLFDAHGRYLGTLLSEEAAERVCNAINGGNL